MWTYLRNIRLSHQKATRHYINQDVESVRLYAHRIIDCLIDLSDKDKLIFIDEFSISTRPSTYYMWGEVGKQPQIRSNEKNRTRTNGFVSVDAISGEIDLWQSSVAKAPQVAEFCFRQAQLALKNDFQKLYIVLDNNKTHLKAMKAIFNQMLTDNNMSIQVIFKHTASYAPKYNPAEYIISMIRRKILHHMATDFTIEQVCERMSEIAQTELLQTKEQVWNTIDHILNSAILGNYSYETL
jgi:DDE superfamily endonuclease